MAVAAIATPFINVSKQEELTKTQSASVFIWSAFLIGGVITMLQWGADELFPEYALELKKYLLPVLIGAAAISISFLFGFYWNGAWSKAVQDSRYSEQDTLADILVLRGFEDEATMLLTVGMIAVRGYDIITRLINKVANAARKFVYVFTGVTILLLWIYMILDMFSGIDILSYAAAVWFVRISQVSFLITLFLASVVYYGLALASFSRVVFGWEMALGYAKLNVTAHSVPDVVSHITVKTLDRVSQGDVALLHRLYDHPDCARTIAAWIGGLVESKQ